MSVQYAIDDVALEYQLDLPPATPPGQVFVRSHKFTLTSSVGTISVPAGRYTLNVDSADVATAQAFVDQRAQNDLFYQDFVAANKAQAGSTNGSSITLASASNGSIYPSTKIIAGVIGTIAKVQVAITGLAHTRPSDIRCGLSGPDGTKTFIFIKAGGSSSITGVNLLFDDSAATALTAGTITPGTYQCSDPFGFVGTNNPFWTFTNTAPGGFWFPVNLSQFNGKTPNGTWNLWTLSDTPGDAGSITSYDLIITLKEPTPQYSG